MTLNQCRLCGNSAGESFSAKEMMYGTREIFRYYECTACRCVQIVEIPYELGPYYPNDYYSYQAGADSLEETVKALVRRCLIGAGNLSTLVRANLVRQRPNLGLLFLYKDLAFNLNAAILDVGCGDGVLLKHLIKLGYRNVIGIDPFVAGDITYRDRILVRQTDIFQIDGEYDVISFHHSLEHLPDQYEVLRRARDLLAPNGCLIIRIPIVGGEAWETYRENWVQLDPPRHLYLHSPESLSLVATKSGLRVSKMIYDSSGFQFWGSELYQRDIPLNDPRSPAKNSKSTVFSAAEMAGFKRRAHLVNGLGRGDQVTALLHRDST